MKMKYLALLAAVVVLLGAIFFVAPDAKAAETPNLCDGSHCVCGGKAKDVGDHECGGDVTYEGVGDDATFRTKVSAGGTVNVYLTSNITLTAQITLAADSTVNICLNGHTLESLAWTFTTSTVNITDCQYDDTAKAADGLPVGGRFIITKNQLTIPSGSTLNVYGGILANGSSGCIVYHSGGTAVTNMYNGYVTSLENGSSYRSLIVVYGTFDMYGGTVDGNGWTSSNALVHTAVTQSGTERAGTINIHGGTIKNGKTAERTSGNNLTADRYAAGNIWVSSKGTLNITGGTIINGEGTTCGDIYCAGTLTISGTPEIGDLYSVGETNKAVLQAFADTNTNYEVTASGSDYILAPKVSEVHKHCICGGKADDVGDHKCTETHPTWTEFDATTIDWAADGHYYLTTDVTLTEQVDISGNVSICLNGYTLAYQVAHATGSGINVIGTFNIADCSASETGMIFFGNADGSSNNRRHCFEGISGTINVFGGELKHGTSSHAYGTSIFTKLQGTEEKLAVLNIYGGKITRISYSSESGSIIKNSADDCYFKINIYDGEITGLGSRAKEQTASRTRGGLIYINSETGTLNITGGTISGGKIIATSETVVLTDTRGGNIYVGAGTLTISGDAEISGGSAMNGGNIYAAGNVTISGGTISGGISTGENAGGNIWISGDLTISGTALIKDGTAHNGGNIYTEGNVTINGGTIQDGTATGNYGGNIQFAGPKAVDEYTTFTMTDGTITGGTVNAVNGGNIAFHGVVATISGGTISGGTSTGTTAKVYYGGGNIALNSGSLTISGTAVISGGVSSNNGGNILVRYTDEYLATKLTISGGTISGGISNNNGGNIYISVDTNKAYVPELEITGGTISDGNAVLGGALYVSSAMPVLIKDATFENNTSTGSETGAIDLRGSTNATLGGELIFTNNGVDLALRTANTKISVAEITNNPTIKLSVRYAYVFTTDEGNVTFEPATERWTFEKITEGENAGFWQSIDHLIFTIGDTEYYNVEDALTAIQGGGVIVIQKDGVAFTLSVNAIVDLNGKNCTITLTNGAVISAFDQAGDGYDENLLGMLTVVMGEGGGSVAGKYDLAVTGGIRKYLTIVNEDGTYSFHRYYLGITYLGINPANKGLGVKATFAGTKTIRDMMVAGGFGVVYGAEGVTYDTALGEAQIKTEVKFGNAGNDAVYTASFIMAGAYTGNDLTTPVYFRAFANLGDTTVEGNTIVKVNPTDVLTKINAAWNGDAEGYATTEDQKAAIQAMCAEINTGAFTALLETLTNITPVESGDAVLAAIPVAKKKYEVNI